MADGPRLKLIFTDGNGAAHTIHLGGGDFDSDAVQRLDSKLDTLHETIERIMAKIKDVETLLDQVNVATNQLASRVLNEQNEIAQLRAQIAAGTPVTEAQLDSVVSRLGVLKTQLEGIGADSENPIPATDPNPPVPGTVG